MSTTSSELSAEEASGNMTHSSAKHLDEKKIGVFVDRLKQTTADPDAFKAIVTSIANDKSLSAAEIIELSQRFVGGPKSKTRKAAITAIGQERLRLSHGEAKAAIAAKSRTW